MTARIGQVLNAFGHIRQTTLFILLVCVFAASFLVLPRPCTVRGYPDTAVSSECACALPSSRLQKKGGSGFVGVQAVTVNSSFKVHTVNLPPALLGTQRAVLLPSLSSTSN